MPILESLAKDHRHLEKIIARLGDLASTEPELRTKTFSKFQAQLSAHSRAEEEVVYRRLRQRGADEQKALEAYEEHHVADILLQELASACPGGRAWAAKVKVLEELLRHHIKEEELNIFPLVTDAFDEATRRRMDQEFQATRHERLETWLGPLRRLTPAFAGRAAITVQASAGRLMRRGELALMRGATQLPARKPRPAKAERGAQSDARAEVTDIAAAGGRGPAQRQRRSGNGATLTH